MANDRRRAVRRRADDRRSSPGNTVDVTRLEHENICGQVDELLRAVHRIEQELRQQRSGIEAIEGELTALMSAVKRTA